MTRSTAAAVADALVASGVSAVYGYPGDPIIELMERMRVVGVETILARREASAAFMAEGHAAATGELGVCLSTLGPGSSALLNGVASAHLDRVPLLAISGQIEFDREQYFTHQVLDHTRLYSPVTKWTGRITPGSMGTVMRKAIRTAHAERPGAVHVSIDGAASKAPVIDDSFRAVPANPTDASFQIVTAPGSPGPSAALAASTRPVILSGIGAMRQNAGAEITALAEAIGAPIVVGAMSKGTVPEDHPLFAGVIDMACNTEIWQLLGEADLILAVGFDAVELIKPWSATAPVIHIDALANTDQILASDIELIGHIPSILDTLRADWSGEPRWSEAEVARHRARVAEVFRSGAVAGRLNPADLVRIAREAMPRDAIGACDVGSHKILMGQGWSTYVPRGFLTTNGLSSMGYGIPAAIGAQLAHPDRTVVAVVGDGGFAMTATELRLAASRNLPLIVIVAVDGSLNRIELKQQVAGYPSTATLIEDTDVVKLSEAIGCDAVRVENEASLERALAAATAAPRTRPLVIEARIDPSQYLSQF